MTMGFQPADDNVLVRLLPPDDSGAAREAEWAEVIVVGPGRRTADGMLVAPDLAAGDRIALRPHSAVHLRVHGEAVAVVSGSDVLGILLHEERPKAAAPARSATATEPALQAHTAPPTEESLETDVAPDLLDQEAPTAEDLH